MGVLVPVRISFGIAEAEGAAEIDDFGAGFEESWSDFDGSFGRRAEKYEVELLLADCIGGGRDRFWLGRSQRLRAIGGIGAVFEENDFDSGVVSQDAEKLGAAVPAETDDTDEVAF